MRIGSFTAGIKRIMRKLISMLSGMGLTYKFLLSYVTIIAIPTVIFGIYIINNVKSSLISDLEKKGQQAVQRILDNTERTVDICETAIQIILSNRTFLDTIPRMDYLTADELLAFKAGFNDISRIRDVNPNIYRLCIYAKDISIVESFATVYSEERIADAPFFNRILRQNGKDYWELAHDDSLTIRGNSPLKEKITSLFREVKNAKGGHIGIVEVSMLTREFFSEVFSKSETEGSFFCIADEENNLIFNNASPGIISMNVNQSELSGALNTKNAGESGTYYTKLNGKPILVIHGYSENINAHIYQISYIDLLSKDLTKAQFRIIALIFVTFVLLSLITYFVISVLLKKVRIMKKYMRKIQQGDLSVDIPPLGDDEIGELAQNFKMMMGRVNELIALKMEDQEAIRQIELKALSAQINSHFTYNSLDTIQMMAEVDEKYEIADAVNLLGKLMRYSIDWRAQYASLKEELNHLKNYISLINIKYGELVELCIYVNADLLPVSIPKMLLQPIVENCVFHGIKPKGIKGIISIDAVVKGQDLIIEIFDNGRGIDENGLNKIRTRLEAAGRSSDLDDTDSIGLANVNDRIRLYYGKRYGLKIESEAYLYTRVLVRLPFASAGGGENEESASC